ncbi:MAG: hypothetical protein F6J93_38890, partial [Oscillatoria sp. SIO1A7]|nr:hypothetical protein [Oscillatoria sp. SIO1A7]
MQLVPSWDWKERYHYHLNQQQPSNAELESELQREISKLASNNGFKLTPLKAGQGLLQPLDPDKGKGAWQGSHAYLKALLENAIELGYFPSIEEQADKIEETLDAIANVQELAWKLSLGNQGLNDNKL